jgi:hypothetical protein
MTNHAPITFRQLFTYFRGLPHQLAAIEEMEEAFRQPGATYESVMTRSRSWFHTWSQDGKQPEASKPAIPTSLRLNVPYFRQLDSVTDQGRRMCFSSSCAMLLATIRPGLIHGPNADDQYLARVRMYGDTTEADAQLRALASYGVNANFAQRADFAAIERSIHRGVPVPVGYLHRGPVSAPAGDGHWAIVIGYDQDALILHDPLGEADMITGATIARTGEGVRYSRRNFAKRWMVEGPGTGWAIIVR